MNKFLVVSNRDIVNAQYFKDPDALEDYLEAFGDYNGIHSILFAFWSWKVGPHILNKYKCYGLHIGFLLDGVGKGGSPIDNLKKLGVRWAALNVFKMTEVIDGGPVRLALPISLEGEKDVVIDHVDMMIPDILSFLEQDITAVPERFKRV